MRELLGSGQRGLGIGSGDGRGKLARFPQEKCIVSWEDPDLAPTGWVGDLLGSPVRALSGTADWVRTYNLKTYNIQICNLKTYKLHGVHFQTTHLVGFLATIRSGYGRGRHARGSGRIREPHLTDAPGRFEPVFWKTWFRVGNDSYMHSF